MAVCHDIRIFTVACDWNVTAKQRRGSIGYTWTDCVVHVNVPFERFWHVQSSASETETLKKKLLKSTKDFT